MCTDVHDGDASQFPYPPFQVFIASGYDEYSMLRYPLHNAVIRIGSFVRALQPLESWVFGYAQSKAVLLAKFLKLCNNAVCDAGNNFAQQTVHRSLEHVQLVLD
eukprot:CAMPEP_0204905274 /NCGR_PEP_ID=MMETSP1397-20131031/5334_1 /ASSEMBLY_ACC=CAM_ASM_000891 /TAXON_ID=49980 /ORGANISM="Climacostomum Climacostomum virens, Strain Stock W-24" /LENGTH=103 /DNA_ID=CAMNT_0052074145 /DNA_START=267 /DNA_END=578 /DNA_ORIENTATION=-